MRTLITGINGFVGGHLAEWLLHLGGWDIWGVSRTLPLGLAHLNDDVRPVQADLRDAEAVRQVIEQVRPEVVFHLAGQTFVPESFSHPADTLTTNILAQLHIFLALIELELPCRVLVAGSNEEYGPIRPEDVPVDEDTPLRPASPYGVSKVAQDMLALQYHQSHQLDVVRVRPFNHIGPRQSERFVASSFAAQIARIEQGQQPPVLRVGNLSARRDFTDVRDMVRAYVLAVETGEAGQVYNIGSGTPVAIQDLLDRLLAASSATVEVQTDPARMRPVDIPTVACDARRFRERTGWQPQIDLDQTLRDILDDWRARLRR
jgi:GDP-4-dehydro-6-deoxy-D-mannose reductase